MEKPTHTSKQHWKHSDCFGFEPFDYANISVRYDYSISMHSHNFYEINIVLDGHSLHQIGNHSVSVSKGSAFVIPPGISHGYSDSIGLNVCHILLSDAFMSRYEDELESLPGFHTLFHIGPMLANRLDTPLFLCMDEEQLCTLSPLLSFSLNDRGEGEHVITGAQSIVIIALLCRYMYRKFLTKDVTGPVNYMSAIVKSLEYIHSNYAKKITIDSLAKHCLLSRSTYLRYFRSICRCSPCEYLTRFRIKKAQEMILTTDLCLSDIADACGFYDAAHFSKQFTQFAGCTPTQYRKGIIT